MTTTEELRAELAAASVELRAMQERAEAAERREHQLGRELTERRRACDGRDSIAHFEGLWLRDSKLLKESESECSALRAEVAELRDIERQLRSSSANQRIAAAIDAIESARLVSGSCESAWAKQALQALRGIGQ